MNRVFTFIRNYWTWIIAVCILSSLGLYVIAVDCGLGMTFDSGLYLSISKAFSDSGFWESLQQPGLESWPPLFPLIISWIGIEYMILLNGISLILLLLICWSISNRLVQAKALRVLMMFVICTGTPLFLVHGFLWSEPFFILLCYSEVALFLAVRKTNSVLAVVALIAVANLMSLQRHSGIFLITGLFLAQLIQSRSSRQVFWGVAYFASASVSFWWWNGWLSQGTNDRIASLIESVLMLDFDRYYLNLQSFGDAISYWVVPYRTIWVLVLILVMTLVALLGPFRWKLVVSGKQTQAYALLVISFLVYYFLLHLPFTITPDSSERYLSPLYPLFIWLVLVPLDWIPRQGVRSVGGKIMLLAVGIWLTYGALRSVKNVAFWFKSRCESSAEAKHFPGNSISANLLTTQAVKACGRTAIAVRPLNVPGIIGPAVQA